MRYRSRRVPGEVHELERLVGIDAGEEELDELLERDAILEREVEPLET